MQRTAQTNRGNLAKFGEEILTDRKAAKDKREAAKAARARHRRVAKSRKDVRVFAETYLAHYCTQPFAAIHLDIFKNFHKIIEAVKTADPAAIEKLREVWALPREHGKTTLMLILLAWAACHGELKYVIVIRETAEIAAAFVTDLREELVDNEKIAEDFGDLLGSRDWRVDRFVTSTGMCVEGFGRGGKLRGRKFGATRPQIIVIDDPQNEEDVNSPEQRRKAKQWFDKSVSFASSTGALFIIGTMLHRDCLIAHCAGKTGYRARICKAVSAFAERADLWDAWRVKYNSDPRLGPARARRFFAGREPEMLAGAQVLWPERHNYYALMVKRNEVGRSAFATELQNDLRDPDAQEFKQFRFYGDADIAGLEMLKVGYLDPALGRGQRGCFQAFITLARAADGRLFVLDDLQTKKPIDRLYGDICAIYMQRRHTRVGVETNGFQELVAQGIADAGRANKTYVPVVGVRHSTDKHARIRSLQPLVENGTIRFREDMKIVGDLEDFPNGDLDAPDALEGALSLIRNLTLIEGQGTGRRRSEFTKPGRRELVDSFW